MVDPNAHIYGKPNALNNSHLSCAPVSYIHHKDSQELKRIIEYLNTLDLEILLVSYSFSALLEDVFHELSETMQCEVVGLYNADSVENQFIFTGFPKQYFRSHVEIIENGASAVYDSLAKFLSVDDKSTSHSRLALTFNHGGLKASDNKFERLLRRFDDEICVFGLEIASGSLDERNFYYDGDWYDQSELILILETPLSIQTYQHPLFKTYENSLIATGVDLENNLLTEIDGEPAAKVYARLLGISVNHIQESLFIHYPLFFRSLHGVELLRIVNIRESGAIELNKPVEMGCLLQLGYNQATEVELSNVIESFQQSFAEVSLIFGFQTPLRDQFLSSWGIKQQIDDSFLGLPLLSNQVSCIYHEGLCLSTDAQFVVIGLADFQSHSSAEVSKVRVNDKLNRQAKMIEALKVRLAELSNRRYIQEDERQPLNLQQSPNLIAEQEAMIAQLKSELELTRKAIDAANQSNHAKSDFLANMSHEIRTPMNGVIGTVNLLEDTPLNDEQKMLVKTLHSSGNALLSLINDILDFSKIEAGKLTLENKPFQLEECIVDCIDLFATQANEKGIDLVYTIGVGVPECIDTDQNRLRQVLVNLLSNAVKFTDQGEIILKVETGFLENNRCELKFSVSDTGPGIPHDKQAALFKRFSQIEGLPQRVPGGTGLGLSISRKLVDLMGGDIWLTSEPGKGSVFYFTIKTEISKLPESAASGLRTDNEVFSGKKCLIVDNNKHVGRIIQEELQRKRFEVSSADSFEQAYNQLLEGFSYDLILFDFSSESSDLKNKLLKLRAIIAGKKTFVLTLVHDRDSIKNLEKDQLKVIEKPIRIKAVLDNYRAYLSVPAEQKEASVYTGQQSSAEPKEPVKTVSSLRILMAEDNPYNQKISKLLISKMGYELDMVSNGKEAVDALLKKDYDVILMDVQMPIMDGFEATQYIRKELPANKQPHIIALTAYALDSDREEAFASGMQDFVTKPINPAHLKEVIEAAAPKQ